MKQLLYILAITSVSMVYSCGSDGTDEEQQPEFTAMQLALHGGDSKFWILTQEKYNGVDITASYQACELDNVYIYDQYENQSVDAGPTTCENNPEPDVKRGYYELDEANKTLEIGNSDTIYVVNILNLSASELKWQIEVDGEMIERTFNPK